MKYFSILFALVFSAVPLTSLFAAEPPVKVMAGDTPLEIPVPEGFANVPEDLENYFSVTQKFVGVNKLLALFYTGEDLQKIKDGDRPDTERNLSVQIHPVAIQGKAGFEDLQDAIKAAEKLTPVNIDAQVDEAARRGNEATGLKDADKEISVNGTKPLPFHSKGKREAAFSILMTVNADDESSKAVVTSTFVLVKAKLLYLYVTSPWKGDADLEWSRKTSAAWAAAVIAANPSDEATEKLENKGSAGSTGKKIGRLAGLVIGGVAGALLIRTIIKRRAKKAIEAAD